MWLTFGSQPTFGPAGHRRSERYSLVYRNRTPQTQNRPGRGVGEGSLPYPVHPRRGQPGVNPDDDGRERQARRHRYVLTHPELRNPVRQAGTETA